jgi:hypothetical protein
MEEKNQANKEVIIASREAEKLSEEVYAIKIRSAADLKTATEKLAQIKKMHKEIEARRKSFVNPLNGVIKEINAQFKNPLDRLTDASSLITKAMIKYQSQIDARAAKKAEKIEASVDSGEMDVVEAMGKLSGVTQAPQTVRSEAGTASFRTVKKFNIVDPFKLPPSYFTRPRVLEALRLEVESDVKLKALPVPDGVEVTEEKQVSMRGTF